MNSYSTDRPDSELWLFVESAHISQGHVDLRLVSVTCDAELTARPMSVHSSGDSVMEAWTPGSIVTSHGAVTAVGVRISGDTRSALDDPVNWTVKLSGDAGLAADVEFVTSSVVDEGLATATLTVGKETGQVQVRFLLIRNTLADPLPCSQSTWLHALSSVLLAGHRGMGVDPSSHPENSIHAFKAAHATGADMVELDVQLSRDDRLVIFHDLHLPGPERQLIRKIDWMDVKKKLPNVTDLPSVFQHVSAQLGIDVEVKYPNEQVNGLLESDLPRLAALTPTSSGTPLSLLFSKCRLASAVLSSVLPESFNRRLLLSTFSPDLALVLSRKIPSDIRPRLPVVQLTRGENHPARGTPTAHADPRLTAVAASTAWATAAGLDGVVAYTASVGDGRVEGKVPVLLWGKELNDVERLRRLTKERWAKVLIFDGIQELLPKVRG